MLAGRAGPARLFVCCIWYCVQKRESPAAAPAQAERARAGREREKNGPQPWPWPLNFNPTYTRTGWIGQPPVLDRHEVVTIDGDVDTLRQATP